MSFFIAQVHIVVLYHETEVVKTSNDELLFERATQTSSIITYHAFTHFKKHLLRFQETMALKFWGLILEAMQR